MSTISTPWAKRALDLHREVASVAEVGRADPRWWLLAAGAAVVEPWPARGAYLVSDAEPGADTFMGFVAPPVEDPIGEAIARAHAARAAIRALDGTLPGQPLAVTVDRDALRAAATTRPIALDRIAFAIGERVVVAPIAAELADEAPLARLLAEAVADGIMAPRGSVERFEREGDAMVTDRAAAPHAPFAAIAIGDERLDHARHGHRRAWTAAGGPWLGLAQAGELAIVSTCHMVVDGFGHAQLASFVARELAHLRGPANELVRAALVPTAAVAARSDALVDISHTLHAHRRAVRSTRVPPPLAAPAMIGPPLGIAWRPLAAETQHGALRLAYALGEILHRRVGRSDAPFSPTLQIPVAPGDVRARVVFSIASVRFDGGGKPEPYAEFAARTREVLAREAAGTGLCARMLAAARATPAPLAWKRRQFSAARPRWLHRISEVLGGRACVSRITLPDEVPPLVAVSSPARLATRGDPLGACVITVVDHAGGGAITACGSSASGLGGNDHDAAALLDELLHTARR